MGSSGGGSSNPAALYQNAAPMGGLPIVGKDSSPVANPYDYGKFQNFLPDIPSDGSAAPLAHGLTSDMFTYKSPGGQAQAGVGDQINDLRTTLAKLQASQNNVMNGAAPDNTASQ